MLLPSSSSTVLPKRLSSFTKLRTLFTVAAGPLILIKVSWAKIVMRSRLDISYTGKDYFNVSLLVDHKNTTLGLLKRVPHADCLNKGSMRVAKKSIWKALPCFEQGIGFGGVCR